MSLPPSAPADGTVPGAVPAGWPPSGWPDRSPRRRADPARWAPGPFHWGDALVVLAYGGIMVLGLGFFLAAALGLVPADPAALSVLDGFTVNLLCYAILVTLVLLVAWRPLVTSLRVFATGTWWKVLLLPALWFTTILVNAVLLSLIGDAQTSANQAALEEMTTQAPPVLMILMTVVGAPLVEEYLFRHLLVGKLSRHINVWICGAISVVTFPLLHFIPALLGASDDLTLVSVVPYVTMGILITVGYIVAGRNLFYAWLIHAFNNFVSLLVAFFVQPWAEGVLEDYENLDSGLATLTVLASIIG